MLQGCSLRFKHAQVLENESIVDQDFPIVRLKRTGTGFFRTRLRGAGSQTLRRMSKELQLASGPPVQDRASVSVKELKEALRLELRTLEAQKADLDQERLQLGWRSGLRYAHGKEAGYPSASDPNNLAGRARKHVGGEALANAKAELDSAQFAYERIAQAVMKHNERMQRRGLLVGVFCAPLDYWRAARLARQWQTVQERKSRAEEAYAQCHRALERPEDRDRVVTMTSKFRMQEREIAVRRQGVELRRAMLLDELELRWSLLRQLSTLPEKTRVPVSHNELSAAIKDPGLIGWLQSVASAVPAR